MLKSERVDMRIRQLRRQGWTWANATVRALVQVRDAHRAAERITRKTTRPSRRVSRDEMDRLALHGDDACCEALMRCREAESAGHNCNWLYDEFGGHASIISAIANELVKG